METIKTAFKQAKFGVAVNFLESTHAPNSDLDAISGYDKEKIYTMFLKEF
jgi:hypothetical protein